MPLEESNVVDMVAGTSDGWLEMVITDSGQIVDADSRNVALKRKLGTYKAYIQGKSFTKDHKGAALDRTRIVVVCSTMPTDEMMGIKGFRLDDGNVIPISYRLFNGTEMVELDDSSGDEQVVVELRKFNNGTFKSCENISIEIQPFKEIVFDLTGCEFASKSPPPDAVVLHLPDDDMLLMMIDEDDEGRRYAMSSSGIRLKDQSTGFDGIEDGEHVASIVKLLEPPKMVPALFLKLSITK